MLRLSKVKQRGKRAFVKGLPNLSKVFKKVPASIVGWYVGERVQFPKCENPSFEARF